jgi:hypothetical protein
VLRHPRADNGGLFCEPAITTATSNVPWGGGGRHMSPKPKQTIFLTFWVADAVSSCDFNALQLALAFQTALFSLSSRLEFSGMPQNSCADTLIHLIKSEQ